MGDFDEYRISNEDIREDDVPRSQAAWQIVEKFALSFDGYKHHGSYARCADIAKRWEAPTRRTARTHVIWTTFEPVCSSSSVAGATSARFRIQRPCATFAPC